LTNWLMGELIGHWLTRMWA